MRNIPFDTRSSEWIGDMTVWLRENSEDNQLQLERLRRNLRLAREQELTPCQQQVLELRYERNMSVTQIARHLGVNASTVSRTLRRAQERLRRYLQYTL
ncbi:sigma-70 family RNA polymerase sigma factor [Oscillibacter valericigenes]|uniref:sigma-70 family RNA polymerase sigma factor n=1 Tax=Oscillibacter valericigenes TaxID=351091 RepID=UPI001F33A000|nr:sigma-70 family RNA polymerase sigma factor [Oscillibacter valericigenes]MCF2664475.1 sigma-70 family RNA polymerase sigma factor [Oscillibacter valericigenes]